MIGRKGNKKAMGLLLVMLALFCAWIPRERAMATSTGTGSTSGNQLTIVEIDYEKETMTIQSSNGDTTLYYSDAKQKTWECAYGKFGNVEVVQDNGTKINLPNAYVLDISWIKKTKDYVLTLKGDKSKTVVSVTLPKQQTSFKVTMDYTTEKFVFTNHNDDTAPVYWRKNNSTTWEKVDTSTYSVIQRFYARGVTLYFRVGQVKGTSATAVGSRPSKEVKLSIVKQAAAPSVTITPSTQVLTLSALLQYRPDGSNSGWTTATEKKLSIPNNVAKNAYISDENSNPMDVVLAFRTAATAKKPASMEKIITIKAQETAPTNAQITVLAASSTSDTTPTSTLSLEIKEVTKTEDGKEIVEVEGASSSNPYEYTMVAPGKELEDTAVWKAVTVSKTTISKVEPGTTIYVRKKAHVASNDKTVYYPESLSRSYVVGTYTREPSTVRLMLDENNAEQESRNAYKKDGKIILAKEAGTKGLEFTFQIVTAMAKDENGDEVPSSELTVNSILCNNIELKDVKQKNENGVITVTITTTDNVEASLTGNAAYPLIITLSNGEVINDSVMLDILKKGYLQQDYSFTLINGVSKNEEYTFNIVSTRTLGNTPGEYGKYETAEIGSIVIKDENNVPYTLKKGQDYEASIPDDSGVIKVTLKGSGLEDYKDNKDKKYTLTITINDNDDVTMRTTITSGVTLIFTQEAETIQSEPGYWGSVTVSEALEKNLEIKMRYKSKGICISQVTLEGSTGEIYLIAGNSYMDSEYVNIVLSKNKINEIITKASGFYKVYVLFSNGAKVDTGCVIKFD